MTPGKSVGGMFYALPGHPITGIRIKQARLVILLKLYGEPGIARRLSGETRSDLKRHFNAYLRYLEMAIERNQQP